MFAVDHILISDDVAEADFSCNLGACKGACCVVGEEGAPVEPDERWKLEEALPIVQDKLRPEALDVILRRGVWEEVDPQVYATTCVNEAECVFVTYDGAIAKCAIQLAYYEGKTDWPKPISCHLFPVRIHDYHGEKVLNYERIDLCDPAREDGKRLGFPLYIFLKEALTRKYGRAWYNAFKDACLRHRKNSQTR